MSKFIPVDPDKWAEMVRAWADLPRWKEICDELDARCNELKAENQRLRESSFVTAVPSHQYERIVKAGDAMAVAINLHDDVFDNHEKKLAQSNWNAAKNGWNAAKEGKQP
jgi:hypothetical protein